MGSRVPDRSSNNYLEAAGNAALVCVPISNTIVLFAQTQVNSWCLHPKQNKWLENGNKTSQSWQVQSKPARTWRGNRFYLDFGSEQNKMVVETESKKFNGVDKLIIAWELWIWDSLLRDSKDKDKTDCWSKWCVLWPFEQEILNVIISINIDTMTVTFNKVVTKNISIKVKTINSVNGRLRERKGRYHRH